MFFFLAKAGGFFFSITHFVILATVLAALGLWTRWTKTARRLTTLGVLLIAVCAFSPLASILLRPLEDRFPKPDLAEPPTGIIVLGGATEQDVSADRNVVALEDPAERLTEGVALARRFPSARLVFTGGSGRIGGARLVEADTAKRFWLELGVPEERMTFETESQDTWQNANFTKALLSPKEGERWLLVTSASHMPRSVGIFRRIGFPVIPYPVDYRTMGTKADFFGVRDATNTFRDLATVSHEYIGLLAYRLAGKTDALFPGP